MNNNLLEVAERVYRRHNTVPLDLAVKLIEAGYIVDELIDYWERGMSYG